MMGGSAPCDGSSAPLRRAQDSLPGVRRQPSRPRPVRVGQDLKVRVGRLQLDDVRDLLGWRSRRGSGGRALRCCRRGRPDGGRRSCRRGSWPAPRRARRRRFARRSGARRPERHTGGGLDEGHPGRGGLAGLNGRGGAGGSGEAGMVVGGQRGRPQGGSRRQILGGGRDGPGRPALSRYKSEVGQT